MTRNKLLQDWWRFKALRMAPGFDIEKWIQNVALNKEHDHQAFAERTYICAAADGILYNNWPWSATP